MKTTNIFFKTKISQDLQATSLINHIKKIGLSIITVTIIMKKTYSITIQ